MKKGKEMVITIVKIGIISRKGGVKNNWGHEVDFWGSDNTLFLDLGGGCKNIRLIIYSSNCIFAVCTFLNVIDSSHTKKNVQQKERKGMCSLFVKCIMIFETEFTSGCLYPAWILYNCCINPLILSGGCCRVQSWLSFIESGKVKNLAQKTWILVLQ